MNNDDDDDKIKKYIKKGFGAFNVGEDPRQRKVKRLSGGGGSTTRRETLPLSFWYKGDRGASGFEWRDRREERRRG
ncbi:hypothetical protein V6Z12_D04G199700 [Gossypium hirsutum]